MVNFWFNNIYISRDVRQIHKLHKTQTGKRDKRIRKMLFVDKYLSISKLILRDNFFKSIKYT